MKFFSLLFSRKQTAVLVAPPTLTTTEQVVGILSTQKSYCTLQEIGDRVGVTRERVRQIIKKEGLVRVVRPNKIYLCEDCGREINNRRSSLCVPCGYRHVTTDRWKYSKCSINNCNRRHEANGYCSPHNKRIEKFGYPQEDTPIRDYSSRPHVVLGCKEKKCGEQHYAKGRCRHHYNAFRLNKQAPIEAK